MTDNMDLGIPVPHDHVVYGPWRLRHKCVKCEVVLNFQERVMNDGICPYCGHKPRFRGGNAQTVEEAVRTVEYYHGRHLWGYGSRRLVATRTEVKVSTD